MVTKDIFFKMYLVLISVTSAWALNPIISLPVVAIFLSVCLFIIKVCLDLKVVYSIKENRFMDYSIRLFLLCGFVGYIRALVLRDSAVEATNYYFSVVFSFSIFYYFVANKLSYLRLTEVIFYTRIGLLLCTTWIIFEFISVNILGINLDLYISRPFNEIYNSTALGSFFRARGPVEESGHVAMCVVILTGVVLALNNIDKARHSLIDKVTYALSLISISLTFSVAAFANIPLAITLTMILFFSSFLKSVNSLSSVTVFFLLFILIYFGLEQFLQVIYIKLDGSSSIDDRSLRYELALELIKNSSLIELLIGFGPGAVRYELEFIVLNLYLLILIDYGILGLFSFIIFVLCNLRVISSIENDKVKIILSSVFIYSLLHFMIIPNYWYPWFWFLLAVIRSVDFESRKN